MLWNVLLGKLIFSLLLFFLFALFPTPVSAQNPPEMKMEAVVTQIKEEKEVENNGIKQPYQKLELLITSGSQKGKKIIVENGQMASVQVTEYGVGDKVIVTATKDIQSKEIYAIADSVRRDALLVLFAIFIIVTLVIGRKKGLLSMIGMAVSFVMIFVYLLPEIAAGKDPIFIAITTAFCIVPFTFFLSHGFNRKTIIAISGTVIALIITGILAQIFITSARLTGFASEEAMFIQAIHKGLINIKGLLLAGIIIGALGILDDITITQTSIIQQLKKAAPDLTVKELYLKGMDVGRDHIASVVNTLILVYTGAALPLLLLFINNPSPFSEVINYEIIAVEIVQTLVASIGLILAVPITTLLAALFIEETSRKH